LAQLGSSSRFGAGLQQQQQIWRRLAAAAAAAADLAQACSSSSKSSTAWQQQQQTWQPLRSFREGTSNQQAMQLQMSSDPSSDQQG
jgi:hypothetical protein